MAYSNTSAAFAATKVRSQSDSDLLAPKQGNNGVFQHGGMRRNTSVDDFETGSKKRNFLHKLVRPWKWRKKKKNGKGAFKNQPWSEILNVSCFKKV